MISLSSLLILGSLNYMHLVSLILDLSLFPPYSPVPKAYHLSFMSAFFVALSPCLPTYQPETPQSLCWAEPELHTPFTHFWFICSSMPLCNYSRLHLLPFPTEVFSPSCMTQNLEIPRGILQHTLPFKIMSGHTYLYCFVFVQRLRYQNFPLVTLCSTLSIFPRILLYQFLPLSLFSTYNALSLFRSE